MQSSNSVQSIKWHRLTLNYKIQLNNWNVKVNGGDAIIESWKWTCSKTISFCRWCTRLSDYLFCISHRASAVAPWVARSKCACWGFVNAAHHWLVAARRRWTHLRVHCFTGTRKAAHIVNWPFWATWHCQVYGMIVKTKMCRIKIVLQPNKWSYDSSTLTQLYM